MRILVCLMFGLLAACSSQNWSAKAPPPDAYTLLLSDLRHGGYILYLRHGETETALEPALRDFADCSWQRNLNEQGYGQAATIGRYLRDKGIPVTAVEASPFCRTRQTAERVFGVAPKLNDDLVYHVSQTQAQIADADARLKARLARVPPRGVNLALVGHAPMMREAASVDLPEGQGAVVKPNGDGTFRVVARLSVNGLTPAAP